MAEQSGDLDALARTILASATGPSRFVLAIAGPPGAGKSTLADALLAELELRSPHCSVLVPMDGFHLDNAVLDARGLRARKGAPETFDVTGYRATMRRIRAGEEVAVPMFDRRLDLSRAGASIVGPGHRIVVTEGNYLLLDQPPWVDLATCFDRTLFLSAPGEVLRARLVQRWLDHGLSPDAASIRAEVNDMRNAGLVEAARLRADDEW